jgi:hypothetical protein
LLLLAAVITPPPETQTCITCKNIEKIILPSTILLLYVCNDGMLDEGEFIISLSRVIVERSHS